MTLPQSLAPLATRLLAAQAALHPGEALAFWDFDGTLIAGDITEGKPAPDAYEGLLRWTAAAGYLPAYDGERGVACLEREYAALAAAEPERAYVFAAEVLTTVLDKQRIAWQRALRERLAPLYASHLLADPLALLDLLARAGVQNHVVSASPHDFISALDGVLPLPAEHLWGINRTRCGPDLLDPIVNYAAGKVERIRALLASRPKARPLFAAGNSWTSDGPMLHFVTAAGGCGLMINAGAAPAWASQRDILILTSTKTIGRAEAALRSDRDRPQGEASGQARQGSRL